ncbi:glycosyltransferase family 4 protein [Vibrio profundi]|uniref:glycosyltransferase family 4 protein n=1 Tax=Vibrio profundi TaxID=1774960 RepID=UPI0037368869
MIMFTQKKALPVHGFIYDPIAFAGGSKVATSEMLLVCKDSDVEFTILTADPSSWSQVQKHVPNTRIIRLPYFAFLCHANGLKYWLSQLYLMTVLLITFIRIKPIDYAVGASGPGIDMALYLCRFIMRFSVIQLIHGPVAPSRSIGYCLSQAKHVYYLDSTYQSICNALYAYFSLTSDPEQNRTLANFSFTSGQMRAFTNGISQLHWPSQASFQSERLFWAASLLEWKGLDIFVSAIDSKFSGLSFTADICYIRPTSTKLAVSELPKNWDNVRLYESPDNLDTIRSQCGIFVSTSDNEPFGLSILESLAAGLSVVIPSDGAYWDQKLTHGENCIKYTPRDELSLRSELGKLVQNTDLRASLSIGGQKITEQYRAELCYAAIAESLTTRRSYVSHQSHDFGARS